MTSKITATVIADSIAGGQRLTTLQLRFPRFILAQFNTHRVFSRNARSSRATPVKVMLEEVRTDPVIPVFKANKRGMQGGEVLTGVRHDMAVEKWLDARDTAVHAARQLLELDVHKEAANRLLEPFSWADVLVTATDWQNFFDLRIHSDAQDEIHQLAVAMRDVMEESEPQSRSFHLPYIAGDEGEEGDFCDDDWYDLMMVSAARCARVSYRPFDSDEADPAKDYRLAVKLQEAGHMSPFEHPAVCDLGKRRSNLQGWSSMRDWV